MAKTYIDTVKYLIQIEFEIKGIVDKPDIIGAVFGQSEGLLGEDLDLRELQKNGRIGRIEITQNTNMGKTKGLLSVPSSLDMVETSILAASIESVDKVGPFESRFFVKNIEDTRNLKRKEIEERAKNLLRKLVVEQIPETQNLIEKVRENTRTADIQEYGIEKIPCGPGIKDEDSLIVVEGRADVLNLLKNGIKNVIAMGGAKPTQTLLNLCRQKTVTLFIDGDRGGDLNARKMADLTDVDFIAKAPEGKEVEELARKEIVMALRKKMPAEIFLSNTTENFNNPNHSNGITHNGGLAHPIAGIQERTERFQERPLPARRPFLKRSPLGNRLQAGFARTPFTPTMRREPMFTQSFEQGFEKQAIEVQETPRTPSIQEEKISPEDEEIFKPLMQELKGSLKAKFLNENNQELKQVEVREMLSALKETKAAKTIIFDGIVTKRVVDEAKTAGIKTVIGVKKGKIEKETGIRVLTIAL